MTSEGAKTDPIPFPTDNSAYRFPVSVKGVLFNRDHVVLLRNERNEWELPGGKLEPDEEPIDTVVRELFEELGVEAEAGPLLDSWVYQIVDGVVVLILTYGCYGKNFESLRVSNEHKALGSFAISEVAGLNMPDGYKRSIATWHKLAHSASSAFSGERQASKR